MRGGARPRRTGPAASIVRGLVDNDGITYIEVDRHGDAVTNGDGTAEPGPWHLDALPLLISAVGLGHPGIRSGATLPAARRGADRPVRPTPRR